MTKTEFLSELRYAIEGRLPSDEVREIIADYNDIFDSGVSEGRSEEAIYEELGSPAKIARRILDEASMETGKRYNLIPANEKSTYTKNLASLLKRFGAYVIDNMIGSLIIFAILVSAFLPFSKHEVVTQTEGAYMSSATPTQNKGQYKTGESGYSAKLYQDKNGLTTKVEVWNSKGKRVFKGSNEEFVEFLDKEGIRYPEEFKARTYVTTVDAFPVDMAVLIFTLPYMMFFMFLGVGNIFIVFIAWKFKGYTPGKKLFNIRLEKINSTELTFSDILLRELIVKTIGNVVTGGLLNIGSFIYACITGENKTVHDLAAKTRVIDVKG